MNLLEQLRAKWQGLITLEAKDKPDERLEIEREIARLEERLRLAQRRVEMKQGRLT